MQVCLLNTTDKPIFVSEIGMTVGAKAKSVVLTELQRLAIVNEYPGLRFINVMMEESHSTKSAKPEHVEPLAEEESTKTRRGKKWQDTQ